MGSIKDHMLLNDLDAYFKKLIEFTYKGNNLNFRVSQTLFSSQGIDIGTQRLLRTLTPEMFRNTKKILDLGCGYGPIGIALGKVNMYSIIHMVDRDALALDYSRQNTKLNKIENVNIYGSLGYDEVTETDFDLIVSNIPAKVGEPVISHILHEARFYLRPKGWVAIVVIDAIADYVAEVLTDSSFKIIFHKSWPGHVVYHYEFSDMSNHTPAPSKTVFERGIYDRIGKDIMVGEVRTPFQITYGLSEFDTLSYETELILNNLKVTHDQLIDRVILFNSGQGIIPVALSKTTRVQEMVLADRDLLALKTSYRNLVLNGFPPNNVKVLHQVGIYRNNQDKADYIIGVLNEKDTPKVNEMFLRQAVFQLASKGLTILASSSTAITRLETLVRTEKLLDTSERKKYKGKSIIILRSKK